MTHTHYRLTCDRCNRRELGCGDGRQGTHETETDLLLEAHRAGWGRLDMPSGDTWDLCCRCCEIRQLELADAATLLSQKQGGFCDLTPPPK